MSKKSLKQNQVLNQYKNRQELEKVKNKPFWNSHSYKVKKDY